MAYTALGSLPLFLISAYSVRLQQELGFGPALYGTAISLYFAVSAVVSPFIGRFVERVGARAAMRGAAACSLSALLLLGAVADSWPALAVCLALGALANGLSQMSANVALARGIVSHRQGVAFGLKQSAVPIAGLAAGAWLPAISGLAGWRTAVLLLAVVPAVAIWLVPRLGAPTPRTAAGKGRRAVDRRLFSLALTAALAGAIGNSLAVFIVDAAVAAGLTEHAGAVVLAVGSAASITTRVAVGWFVDRRGSDATTELITLMVGGAVGLLLLVFSTGQPVLFTGAAVLAFAAGWGWPGLLHYHAVRSSGRSPGVATGIVASGTFLGTVVGPASIGFLVAHGSYALAWACCTAVMAAAALSMTYARRSRPRQ
ncbi:MFS transporter [Salinactinospora qingdaonensis]|uniref:Major facilitator superfamily (MFS) profile domain-containing protein n=1 Tax=Salinactinospora qingdaonensis TaxID=702744 RepID=A0ABP7GFA9_9ACTN